MNTKEELILAIKNTLKAKGMTMSGLASQMTGRNGKIGVSQASLSQTINGNPSLEKLIEIANIVGCSVPELLGGNSPEIKVIVNNTEYSLVKGKG